MQFRKLSLLLFIATLLSQSQAAENPGDRIWTGKNGATFRGVYAETIENGGKIRFFTTNGKMLLVAFGNLIESDQKIILGIEGKAAPGEKQEKSSFDPDAFKVLPIADRGLIPERDPKDFGGTDEEAIVDALWVSLLWWNAFEVMPIPKTGDFDRKAEWLHKDLTRFVGEGRSGTTTLHEAKQGIEKYFSHRLEEKGAVKASILNNRCLMPADLELMTNGNQIVVLKLSMDYGNSDNFSTSAALERASADGTFALHLFGNRHTGRLVEQAGEKPAYPAQENGKPTEGKVYELVLNDRTSLPERHIENEAKFFINRKSWGGALILEPYVYKVEGEPAPLPDN